MSEKQPVENEIHTIRDTESLESKLNKYREDLFKLVQTNEALNDDLKASIMDVLVPNTKEEFLNLGFKLLQVGLVHELFNCILSDLANIFGCINEHSIRMKECENEFNKVLTEENKELELTFNQWTKENKDKTFDELNSELNIDFTQPVINSPIDYYKEGFALSKIEGYKVPKLFGICVNYINDKNEVLYCDVLGMTAVSKSLEENIFGSEYTAIAKYIYALNNNSFNNVNESLSIYLNQTEISKMMKTFAPFLMRNKVEAPIKSALNTVFEHSITGNGNFKVEYTLSIIYDYNIKIDTLSMSEMYLVMYYEKLINAKLESIYSELSAGVVHAIHKHRYSQLDFNIIIEDIKEDNIELIDSDIDYIKAAIQIITVQNDIKYLIKKFNRLLPDVIWTLNSNPRIGNTFITCIERKELLQFYDYYKVKGAFHYIVSKDKYPHVFLNNSIF